MMDADKMALLFVQQWLFENGHSEALAALEKSSSFTYDDTKLVKSSQLMQVGSMMSRGVHPEAKHVILNGRRLSARSI